MQLKVIGSNSSGNGYLLQSSNDTLLIECGVHISKIKKALNFKINNVNAIVSHSHGDHSVSIKQVMNAGISVYSGKETFKATGVDSHHRAKVIKADKMYKIGSFEVQPFPVHHDVPCFGFMIYHPEMGLCVFITDTCYSDFVFPSAKHFIIESNHSEELIEQNNTQEFLKRRIENSHMNLSTCKELLLANDLSKVNNVVLIHLSERNSDARLFKKEIEEATGKMVKVAEPGVTINFNVNPF